MDEQQELNDLIEWRINAATENIKANALIFKERALTAEAKLQTALTLLERVLPYFPDIKDSDLELDILRLNIKDALKDKK